MNHPDRINTADVPFKIASASMHEYSDEEYGIKVRNRRSGANNETPGQAHDPVGDIVLSQR